MNKNPNILKNSAYRYGRFYYRDLGKITDSMNLNLYMDGIKRDRYSLFYFVQGGFSQAYKLIIRDILMSLRS